VFDLYLVLVNYTEMGDDEGGYGGGYAEIHETSLDASMWLPADGCCILSPQTQEKLNISTSEFAQGEEYFADENQDRSDHEGPTGNEGCPMSRWYLGVLLLHTTYTHIHTTASRAERRLL
jgi:hypothetical protein